MDQLGLVDEAATSLEFLTTWLHPVFHDVPEIKAPSSTITTCSPAHSVANPAASAPASAPPCTPECPRIGVNPQPARPGSPRASAPARSGRAWAASWLERGLSPV